MRTWLVIFFIAITISINAFDYNLTTATQTELFKVQNQRGNEVELHFQLSSIEMEKVSIKGKEYVQLRHTDAGYLKEEGMPELPTFSTFVAIPADGNVSVEVVKYTTDVIANASPIPSLGDVYEEETVKQATCNEAYYRSSEIYPQSVYQVGEPQVLRDYRIVNIQVQPFAYNPATNSIEVRNDIVHQNKSNLSCKHNSIKSTDFA